MNFICLASFQCELSNASSSCLPERMHNRIGCICLTFLHCVFSNVTSNYLPEMMHIRTGCICLTFLHSAFSDVSLSCLLERMQNHTGCICLIFPYVHWQPSHWRSSARNYHFQDFVPSQPGDKVCPLLLLVLNCESSNVELKKTRKWKWNHSN